MQIEVFERRVRELLDKILVRKFAFYALGLVTALNIAMALFLLSRFVITFYFYFLNLLGLNIGLVAYLGLDRIKVLKEIKMGSKVNAALLLLFISFMFISYLSILYSVNYRSIYYYIFTTLAFFTILPRIFFDEMKKRNAMIILMQLMALSFLERISLFIMHDFPPWWDPYFHYATSLTVYNNAHIPNLAGYTYFPLYYIFNSEIWLMIFGDTSMNYIVINALILVISLILPYLIAERITKSERAGVFASTLIMIVYNFFGMTNFQTPHPFSFTLAMLSIYLLYRIIFEGINYRLIGIFLISSIGSFIFHPSGGLFLSYLSIGLIIFRMLFNVRRYLVFLIFPLFVFLYLINLAQNQLGYYISLSFGAQGLSVENPVYPGFSSTFAQITFYTLSHFWYFAVAFFTALGLFTLILSNKKNYFLPVLAVIAVLPTTTLFFTGRAVAETIGTGFIVLAEVLLGGIALRSTFKKTIAIFFIILLTFSFFSSTLLSDDAPYFGKAINGNYTYYIQQTYYTNEQSISAASLLVNNMQGNILVNSTDDRAFAACCSISVKGYVHLDPSIYVVSNNTYYFISYYITSRWPALPPQAYENFARNMTANPNVNLIYSNGDTIIFFSSIHKK
ncbi:MAG TPA: hypothetical protein VKU94_07440 [Geobacterales bacterium]|nr:hypothetical protein [Geobacterales bacterium]